MSIVLVSILIFVVTLGAGLIGLYAHSKLPPEQKNDSARSVVGQVAGLVSLLLALVLGTLIGTSFGFFGGQKTALEGLSAQNSGARPGARAVRSRDEAGARQAQGSDAKGL